jgi:DNA repair protein RadC
MTKETNTVAEISVSYKPAITNKPIITSSGDAYTLIRKFFSDDTIHLQESFIVMYLNRASKVLGIYTASNGGINGTVADIRLILAVALKCAASNIILAHNHPSCSLKPSPQDVELTSKMREAAKIMDIRIVDHLIISPNDAYLSFADEGLLGHN